MVLCWPTNGAMLASFGLDIGILCDSLHSILLLSVILRSDFLGRALFRPQVWLSGKLLLQQPYPIVAGDAGPHRRVHCFGP